MTSTPEADFSRALISDRPTPKYPARMRRFGQLVGTWDARGRRLNEASGEWEDRAFTWIVAFVLGGRGVQDIEISSDAKHSDSRDSLATALRIYDPTAGVIRVSYFAPVLNRYANLVAIGWRDGIRQDGTQNDGRLVRWNFSSIAPESYTWDGWCSSDDGATWLHVEHVEGTRMAS